MRARPQGRREHAREYANSSETDQDQESPSDSDAARPFFILFFKFIFLFFGNFKCLWKDNAADAAIAQQ